MRSAGPAGDAKTQIPMMHREKTELGNPVLRPGQCYEIKNKPFSIDKSLDGRGCNFSVLGERKYYRITDAGKYSDYIYSYYIYKEPRK